MATRVVSATEFKARCLGIIDEVEQSGDTVTITRRGRPVALLCPPETTAWKSPRNSLASRGHIVGEIVNGDAATHWDIPRQE